MSRYITWLTFQRLPQIQKIMDSIFKTKNAKTKSNMKENVIEYLTEEKLHSKHLLEYLRNAMLSKQAKELKREDPATFCEVIAFLEEMEKEVKKILARLGK